MESGFVRDAQTEGEGMMDAMGQQVLGWVMFVVGGAMLFLFGFIEVNLPGLIFGMALLVSGSVFINAGCIVVTLQDNRPLKGEADAETRKKNNIEP
jgi:hypothetical protein